MSEVLIRKATSQDLETIKSLADAHRRELGFVLRPALLRSIKRNEVLVAEDRGKLIGFAEYHHRKDGQTTLYHIAVTHVYRRQGIGQALVEYILKEAKKLGQRFLLLKCPADLPANKFYLAIGFNFFGHEVTKNKILNQWKFHLLNI